jgi:hypothetical protein
MWHWVIIYSILRFYRDGARVEGRGAGGSCPSISMYREWCIDQLAVAVGVYGARLTGQLVGQLGFRTAPGRVRRLGQTRQLAARG